MNYRFLFKVSISIVFILTVLPCCTKNYTLLSAQSKTEISWKMIDTLSIPLPPSEHPRLYLRSSHAVGLVSRINEPVLQPVIGKLKSQSSQSLQFKVEWDAIQYLITKNKTLGRNTIDSTLALLKRTELGERHDPARVTGRMMVTGAIVYDWIYPLLTSTEKDAFIREFIRLAKTLECGYPPTMQGSVTGHSSESFIMRDMLSAGIAIYDEFPEMYELAASRFFREHLPVRNWLYNGHAYHQGDSYGPLRYSWDTYPLMIYDRMGVDNVYNPEQRNVPYFYIYGTRPDGQRMRAGDNYAHSAPRGRPWGQYVGTLFTASYYHDGILLEQFLRQGGSDGNENIFQFLWRDVTLQPKSINSLPLSRYFGSPFGWMIARTGWDDKAAIVEMKINVYNFNNHQHLDAGSFQIYYQGPLATESGLYQGSSGGYGCPHDKNYQWRTIAHNSLLIYNPQEQFSSKGDYGNDGGQRLPNNRVEPRNQNVILDPGNSYKTGGVLAQGFGPSAQTPEYTYLKGNITNAYSAKVKDVKRSFIFLNLKNEVVPAALIVFDKVVSSSPSYKKYWLLHSIEEPITKGNEVTISRTMSGENGILVNTCLLPEMNNLEVSTVGGPGKEFWVFGTNYESEPRYPRGNSYERAAWRVELSPEQPAEENYFLNVMQVMENKSQKLSVGKIEGERIVGVRIADRIVFLSKSSERIDSSLSFSIQEEGNFKILITDLSPGTWLVMKDNKIVSPAVSVRSDDGILYLEGKRGEYKISRQ